MAAFVVSLIPLMIKIDENVEGLMVDDRTHKSKLFADDLKVFVKSLTEIDTIETTISNFEVVSGVLLHRDPR